MNRLRNLLISVLVVTLVHVVSQPSAGSASRVDTVLSRAEEGRVAEILAAASRARDADSRIVVISRHFLGSPYAPNALSGVSTLKESLVVELERFDCFTFLDTVEALRRTGNVDNFPDNLTAVRYKDREISFFKRRHFFSDWVSDGEDVVVDVTTAIASGSALQVRKNLNQRTVESLWIPEIPVASRVITYIPSAAIDNNVLGRLRNGDYVGFYTSKPGLDVSHTGLIVKKGRKVLLRHASSRTGQDMVRDEELTNYVRSHEGLVVYRVRHVDM